MERTRKVLIVDDSVTSLKLLEKMVREMPGFQVAGVARDGAEAIKQFTALTPDIVVMDVVMPVIDGLQAARAILAAVGEAKVVMVTSTASTTEVIDEALRLGVSNVLQKPIDADSLKSVLVSL